MMRNIHIAFVLTATLAVQPIFADDQTMATPDSKPCKALAQACLKAGFSRMDSSNKKIWQNCMKPLLLGQAVQGVTLDANVVKTCRDNKIQELQKFLADLQHVPSN